MTDTTSIPLAIDPRPAEMEAATCQQCGSKDVFSEDLVNEFVRLAELSAAYVEFAEPSEDLAQEGGVVALLR